MEKQFIDKLAYVHIVGEKVLITLSKGKDTIPGGKREKDESDHEALIREIKEELSVNLIPETIKYFGTFEAQAHCKPIGTIVRNSFSLITNNSPSLITLNLLPIIFNAELSLSA